MNSNVEITSNSSVCRFYLRGICRFGPDCRFQHPQTENDTQSSNTMETSPRNVKVSTLNVKAKPFVPKQQQGSDQSPDIKSATLVEGKSYAEVVCGAVGGVPPNHVSLPVECPFEVCPYGDLCHFIHLEYCDLCCEFRLHPTDKEQRRKHYNDCVKRLEKDMELSFAIARSKDKTCGICFDEIMEKPSREQRFGILPNCNHVYCLQCIRKWRQTEQFEHHITRSCPECRIASDYVCPSPFWVDTKEEKEKLITDYKAALGEKDCKYFKKGEGRCPFGNKCFYKHALSNGELVDVGSPQRHARKLNTSDEEIMDLFDIYLWDFVGRRNYQWFTLNSSDTDDDSDWSNDFD